MFISGIKAKWADSSTVSRIRDSSRALTAQLDDLKTTFATFIPHQSAALEALQTPTPPPAESVDRSLLGLLTAKDQDVVAGSSLPVLIPTEKELIEQLKLVFDEYYYAWSSTAPGVELTLEGSRLAYLVREPSLTSPGTSDSIRDTVGRVTTSEHVWYASWQEFGASYVLGLACTEAGDSRCASDAYLLGTAKSLRYIGGGRKGVGKIETPPLMQGGDAGAEGCSQVFPCNPPGVLVSGSGQGRKDYKVYAAGIRFPTEKKPAFANSQVWGTGGKNGPAGGQCAEANYSYPWWDNFCETRVDRVTPMCPALTGHQGQDIRPPTCEKDIHTVVSAVDGKVTQVGTYTVYITAKDGTRFHYLHMSNV